MGKQQNNIYFENSAKHITDKGLKNSSAQMIPPNSIVYSSRAPIGHINIVATSFTTNQGCKSIAPILMNNRFIYWTLKNRTKDIQKRASGTTFKEISGAGFGETLVYIPHLRALPEPSTSLRFGETLVYIPPIEEQQRISKKVEELFVKVFDYTQKYNALKKLNNEFPDKLRKSILQYAMQGKLVQQDPNDEPVEVLLEKIRAEKQKLFEEGKLKKKDLQESIIYKGDDNSYYEKKGKIIKKVNIDFDRAEEWLLQPISNCFINIATKQFQIKQSEIKLNGKYPVVSQSANLVEGYSDKADRLFIHPKPILVFGDHTKNIKYIDFDFIVGADGTKILEPIFLTPQFASLSIKNALYHVKNRGYARHYLYLQKKVIGIPSISMQNILVNQVEQFFDIVNRLLE
jgi:Restriction endonuclease S subunits